VIAAGIVLLLSSKAAVPDAAVAAGPPPTLLGAWEVEHVAVDRSDQPHWQYQPDDPYLMGRQLLIDGGSVSFNAGKDATCSPGGWQRHATTWGHLLGDGFPKAGDSTTSPADYGLKVSARVRVTAYSLCPTPPGQLRPGVVPVWARDDVWLVQQAPDRLVMHLDSQVMLILTRRRPDAKPRASFSCDKASTPTEKAICGSFTLAALDRSVALAWRRSSVSSGVSAERLQEQKAWLRTRDACGTDAACLERVMDQRITQLPK
jgi:hypothetical protein